MNMSRSRRFLKSPRLPLSFTAGPPIQPYDQLLRWLDSVGTAGKSRRLLKLPVCIQFVDISHWAIASAHIGTDIEDLAHGALVLSLDDGGLGQSLLSVLQTLCPPDSDSCALWLEGYWGPLLTPVGKEPHGIKEDGSSASDQSKDSELQWFAVLSIGSLITAETQSQSLTALIH